MGAQGGSLAIRADYNGPAAATRTLWLLVAEWEHARTKVLCSADHPVHVRLNRTSQQITVQFSALATDLSGAFIVASVQRVSTVPVVSDGAVPVD